MRNLHNILSDKCGIEALHLLREWDMLQVKDSDYRNHHRFTFRCISQGIIPVTFRLQTIVKSEEAMKIIRKAESHLVHARVKSINSFLDNNNKQLDRCRSQIASIVTTKTMEECQNLINRVREFRHLKIRDRQINKFNRLVEKLTWGGVWAVHKTLTHAWVPVLATQLLQSQTTVTTPSWEMCQAMPRTKDFDLEVQLQCLCSSCSQDT